MVTTERLQTLTEEAERTLHSLGYSNVRLYHAKETLGWQRETPYDAIIATAGAPEVPEGLVDQLVIGGRRLVIPVGSHPQQELCRMTRCKNGNEIETMGACRFVSLVGRRA